MKKSIVASVLVLFFTLPGGLIAQENTTPSKDNAQNVIKLNFDGLFTGRYQFAYERLLGRYTTVQLSAGLLYDLEISESVGSNVNVNRELSGVEPKPLRGTHSAVCRIFKVHQYFNTMKKNACKLR